MAELILEKILVAIDFSEQSNIALEQALFAAEKGSAEIVLLWVGHQPKGSPLGAEMYNSGSTDVDKLMADKRAEAEAKLEVLADRVRSRDIPVSTRIEVGYPDEVIVEVSARIGAAIIVVGTKGLTGLKRLLLGSVAEKVARTSHTNVLVARGEARRFARILVATDFSPASERALQVASALAAPTARIDVLHSWQYPAGLHGVRTAEPTEGPLADIRDQIVARVDKLGAALVERYRSATREVHFVREFGSAREVIHDRLEAEPYDLVATGTHGYRGVRRFLLGSVAEATLRHAPCSVLIAHPSSDD